MERTYQLGLRGLGRYGVGVDRTGHLRRAADARDPPGRVPRPGVDRRLRSAWNARSRPSSCSSSTPISSLAIVVGKLFSALDLRLAAHRGVDPADGHRVRLRRGRPRRRPARLHRPDRHGARLRGVRPAGVEPGQADPGGDRDQRSSASCSLSIGTLFLLVFWQAMATSTTTAAASGRSRDRRRRRLAYLNPFLAQVDVLCGTESSFGGWCSIEVGAHARQQQRGHLPVGQTRPSDADPGTGRPSERAASSSATTGRRSTPRVCRLTTSRPSSGSWPSPTQRGRRAAERGGLVVPADVVPFGVTRDALWTKSVAAWFVLAVIFLLLSSQFVSPTRRWRLRRRPPQSAEGEA